MTAALVQEQCELGRRQLMEMQYLQAEATLSAAEQAAWDAQDWDSLARLYLPLQEAHRQRRRRCGEGIVRLDLTAESAFDRIDGRHIVENFPFGQLLVAGWADIAAGFEFAKFRETRHCSSRRFWRPSIQHRAAGAS